ncbi:ABC transporter permease [Paenibacillus eucommiae]|uniref:Aldouronate transport system permease protein n=1 Tax=Paenibacillus eucommiae TaxID=1355755 RepID=A0ABS4J1G7_9BACL|nr:ABC transporter permease subunit [Paenibacillus eucommiae]MBP1993666.1 putative aldouronate transport system permease protein [Paenibacillus eucommiae]
MELIQKMNRYKFLYVLLSGALIWTLVFCYVPMLGIIMSFQDFNIFKGFFGSEFVGLKHFVTIFTDPVFLKAIWNTLLYNSVILFLGFPCPIILALLFNELRGVFFKRAVQTISYLPYFLSWISVVALFYAFFEMAGPFNDLKVLIFGEQVERTNILMDPDNFLGILFGSHLWKNIGWSSVIFLAAIASIDSQLYEAAVVDGAGRWKQVLHITLPSIWPTVMIIFILSSGSLVSSNFEQVFGFQNLYTMEQTQVVNTVVYKLGVQQGNYSLATAFGLAQGIVSFLIVYVVNLVAKKVSNVGIW